MTRCRAEPWAQRSVGASACSGTQAPAVGFAGTWAQRFMGPSVCSGTRASAMGFAGTWAQRSMGHFTQACCCVTRLLTLHPEAGDVLRPSGGASTACRMTCWLTVILALALREEVMVYRMVSDGCCRERSHPSVPYHDLQKSWRHECHIYPKSPTTSSPRRHLLPLDQEEALCPGGASSLLHHTPPRTFTLGILPHHMPGGPKLPFCPTLRTLGAISGLKT